MMTNDIFLVVSWIAETGASDLSPQRSERVKKKARSQRPPDSRAPTPPSGLTGAMGDFGEGPLGTKLGQGATAVKYPRPTRVKNKTPAPTQVRPRAAARRAFSSRLLEISLLPRLERVSPPAMIDAR
jgi:hypothetical protein